MTDLDLRTWFPVEKALPDHELDRQSEFYALFRDVLTRLCREPETPSPIELVLAAAVTGDLWILFREQLNLGAVLDACDKGSTKDARRAAFLAADDRFRMRSLAMASMRQSFTFAREMPALVRRGRPRKPQGDVLTFPARAADGQGS
jgi:hypothetical protein